MAAACASLAALLAVHHPVADAQQGEAADVPPLIVFAEHEGHAARAALSAAAAATLEAIHSDPAASGVRIGHGSPAAVAAALDARVLSVVTPSAPGASGTSGASADAAQALVTFTGVEVEHNDGDMTSLHAHDEATDSEVAVVIQGADVLGSIRRGDETWKIHPLGGGLTAVYHYDTSRLRRHPRGWGDLMLKNELLQRQAPAMPSRDDIGPEGAGADAGADAGDVIDVLVAYTPGARAAAGNIDAFIQFAIDNTHRIYANSNIGLRLRLVHKHQTSYTGHPSNMSVDLERLTATSGTIIQGRQWDPDGYMDEVHGLRDLHGADLVALVTARQTDNTCGVAWVPDFGRHPDTDFGVLGFSVTAWNCETITHHTFAHELGHNQGAAHDPDNTCDDPPCTLAPPPTFLYRYGRCNTAEGWHTTMSYSSNLQGSCPREIEYFSSPLLSYRGTPTGDAARRDNRRVLIETARQVARYRQSKAPQTRTHTLPLVTHASNAERQGFMRIINHSGRAGEVRISAIDDRGRRFGPVSLSLAARAAAHFNSYDLENGNSGKGLSGGVGNGSGNWRVELTTDLEIEPLAYIRTSDGFVTSMHEVAAETQEGSNRWHVPFFNPGRNRNQVSSLRLINPGSGSASIEITGIDDGGRAPPLGAVRLTLGAGAARMLTASQLENGSSGLSGRLGAGEGKWRLSVSADGPIQAMSLLQLPTGHLANLSRGWEGVSVGMSPPPPSGDPDLVVQSPSVSDTTPSAGQSFTLRATVRNQGSGRSAATTLRYYRSSNSTISRADTRVGTDAVSGLAASGASPESIGLTAPSSAGTYYYGACVDPVSGETDTGNNCSSAVRITPGTTGTKASYCNSGNSRYGAIAPGWKGQYCGDGFGWGYSYNYRDRDSAISRAESECRSRGLRDCEWVVVFARCGAMAYGASSSACGHRGGYGATRSAAEQDALSECRADYPDCRIPAGAAGTGAGATPLDEAQSGSGITDSPFGASNPEARPEPEPSRRSDGR